MATWFINARKRVWKPLIHQDKDHDELTGATAASAASTRKDESESGAEDHEDIESDTEMAETGNAIPLVIPPPPPVQRKNVCGALVSQGAPLLPDWQKCYMAVSRSYEDLLALAPQSDYMLQDESEV